MFEFLVMIIMKISLFSLLIFSSSWTAQKVTQGHTLRTLILDLRCNKREKGHNLKISLPHTAPWKLSQIHHDAFIWITDVSDPWTEIPA